MFIHKASLPRRRINPRVVFERLFGGGGTREDRLARMRGRIPL